MSQIVINNNEELTVTNPINIAVQAEEVAALTANLHQLMRTRGVSEAELARRSHIPQPTLHKILSGKTDDPRASTLKALANAFEISIDELLSGANIPRQINGMPKTQSISIISWSECIDAANFIKNLTPTNWSNWIVSEYLSQNAYGLISKSSMEPCFPKRTVLIIDPDTMAEDGDMVVAHYPNTQEATLRKLSTDGPTKLLLPINANSSLSDFDKGIRILGVVIRSVFSFHT
jgi:SOS-response transcriptional repressor LexA